MLNPDEQVWNHLKRELGKMYIETKKEMRRITINAIRSIQKRTSLIRSSFMLEQTKYDTGAKYQGSRRSYRETSKIKLSAQAHDLISAMASVH